MNRLNRVLAAVDLSACSISALRQAMRLARSNEAELRVLHVVDNDIVRGVASASAASVTEVRQGFRLDVSKTLEEAVAEAGEGVNVHCAVETGNVLDTILRTVKDWRADLLVLGTSGHRGAADVGNIAVKCVRKAETKVLLVREQQRTPFRTVLACVDFSETSEDVCVQGARVAGQDDADLTVLHVHNPPWRFARYGHYRIPPTHTTPEERRNYEQGLRSRLESWTRDALADATPVRMRTELGEYTSTASRGISDYIERVGTDLVVVGTRGRSNLSYVLLGSTAEDMLHRVRSSVLAIKPRGFAFDLGPAAADAA